MSNPAETFPDSVGETLDLRGLRCPLPILRTKQALAPLVSGTVLRLVCTDPGAPADFVAFCQKTGHQLLLLQTETTLPTDWGLSPAASGETDTYFFCWIQRR